MTAKEAVEKIRLREGWNIIDDGNTLQWRYEVKGGNKVPITDVTKEAEHTPFHELLPKDRDKGALRFPDGTIVLVSSHTPGDWLIVTEATEANTAGINQG